MRRGQPPAVALAALLLICGLCLPQAASSTDALWLQGLYYDNMNKANLKEGILFMSPPEHKSPPDESHPWKPEDIPFKYADIELGMEGVKVSAGTGMITGPEIPILPRIGVSYAHLKTQDLAGIEAVASIGVPAGEGSFAIPLGVSVKIGYYKGLNHTPNRWMIGLGFGL